MAKVQLNDDLFCKNQSIDLQKQHLLKQVAQLQKILNKFEIKVEASSINFNAKITNDLENQKKNKNYIPISGEFTEKQLETFDKLLDCFLSNQNNQYEFNDTHIAVNAATQSGKTGFINLCSFVPLIVNLLTKKHICLFRLIVDNLDLAEEADITSKDFQKLYGSIIFEHKKNQLTLNEYHEKKLHLFPELGHEMGYDTPSTGEIIRTSPSKKNKTNRSFEIVKNNFNKGMRAIVFCDESHARIDPNGTLTKMLDIIRFDPQSWLNDGFSYIGLSATNYAFSTFCANNGYRVLTMSPGEKYTGFGWINGISEKMIRPKVLSIEEFDKLAGTQLSKFDTRKLAHQKANDEGYDDNRSGWINSFIKMVKWCLLEKNPANGNGLFARVIVNNDTTDGLAESLQEIIPEIEFISFTGSARDTKDSLKRVIEARLKASGRKKYVILFTANGRMGLVLRDDCRYCLECSKKIEPQTLEQAGPGRMTGYNKGIPWIMLCEENAILLNRYMDTGRWEKKSKKSKNFSPVSPYMKYHGIAKRIFEVFDVADHGKVGKKAVEKINLDIKKFAKLKRNQSKLSKSGKKVSRKYTKQKDVRWGGGLEVVYRIMKEKHKINFMTPEIKDGFCPVALRYQGNPNNHNSNIKSDGQAEADPIVRINEFVEAQSICLRREKTTISHKNKSSTYHLPNKNNDCHII